MTMRKTHPRVPVEAGAYFLTLALMVRQWMLTRYGDGREVGMGEAIRLYLVHHGDLPLPEDADALRRLDALREALTTTREGARARASQERAAHG